MCDSDTLVLLADPGLAGKCLQSESERGVNSILITILRF